MKFLFLLLLSIALLSAQGVIRNFPDHWGDPPPVQTKDLVNLPEPYGRGSSTLRNWILENQKKDAMNKESLRIEASEILNHGTFYLDQGQWLAINTAHKREAEVSITLALLPGKFTVTLEAVGDNNGSATHQVFHKDKGILNFTVPVAGKALETAPQFQKTSEPISFELIDTLTIRSKSHGKDDRDYSRGRISAIVLTPVDAEARRQVAKRRNPGENYDPPELPNKIALLQRPRQPDGDGSVTIIGDTQWQPVTLTLDGPFAHELDKKPNPFRDYSLVVTFTHSSGEPEYHVPGYFAADGRAAETSAQSGTKWRAHFSPDLPGEWTYHTSLLAGQDVALQPTETFPDEPLETLGSYTQSGTFTIKPAPKNAPGFYREGRLTYVGKHHLQFAGSKRYFLKAGADSPETLLGYVDFDGTTASTKKVPLKTFAPHVRDWQMGDPTWQNGKGKGLIGALNYLSGKGMNAFSFLPYNAGGDGDNVWPFVSRDQKFHYDCSKLDQWNLVFTHAQSKGLFLHFKLQETEMDDDNLGHGKAKKGKVPTALDGGDLGPERTLYCRELVARFGHHLALNWNLGEENSQTTKQQVAMARCLRGYDPYDHHLVVHTFPNQQDKVYRPLLGAQTLTGVSLQNSHLKDVHWQTVKWRRLSGKAKHPWAIAFDEPGDATYGMPPDPDYPGMPKNYQGPSVDQTRKWVLWGNLLGGGWGVEYYFGYKLPQNDLVCENWRSRDQSWTYAGYALDFFRDQKIPFWDMAPQPELVGNPAKGNQAYCLAGKHLYLIALPDGGNCQLKPTKAESPVSVRWFNPRNGIMRGSSRLSSFQINAPDKNDWVAIVKTK